MRERKKINAKKPLSTKENLAPHKQKIGFRSQSSHVDQILFLQRTIGNQAVQRLIKSGTLQAKLKIGQPGDRYEQEADRIADQVISMPDPKLQRQPENEEEEETLQTKPSADQITPLVQKQEDIPEEEQQTAQAKGDGPATTSYSIESAINSIRHSGKPLPVSTRAFLEPRFGADFSGVRVHSDSKANHLARSINAKAFTVGQDVVFGSGQYSPGSRTGRSLLAHEMTHVVQQSSAKIKGNSSSVIRRELARTQTYITNIYVDLSTQDVSWVYSDGTRSASHLTSTGAGICRNDRSVCHSGNTPGTACTPVGGPFPVTGNRSPHRYVHFIDFGRPSIGFHYYSKVDGCPWSHGCVRLRRNAIDLLHSGVVTVRQARTRGVAPTQVWVSGQPNIIRCWTTANGGLCYIRNATGRGRTRRRCAKNDCFPMGDFPIPDMSDQATRYA